MRSAGSAVPMPPTRYRLPRRIAFGSMEMPFTVIGRLTIAFGHTCAIGLAALKSGIRSAEAGGTIPLVLLGVELVPGAALPLGLIEAEADADALGVPTVVGPGPARSTGTSAT